MTLWTSVSAWPWRMAHKAEEGQKLAGSTFLAEISLKHRPNLGQNVSKIQERHSPSEFSVSEEETFRPLAWSRWGPQGVSACLSACLLLLYARDFRNKNSWWRLSDTSAWEEKGDNLPCLVAVPGRTTFLTAEEITEQRLGLVMRSPPGNIISALCRKKCLVRHSQCREIHNLYNQKKGSKDK